jgi:hypothetical protein
MKVIYLYRATGDGLTAPFHAYDPSQPPGDVAHIKVNGKTVPFIVRFEMGTINRFIYSIASLAPRPHVAHPGHPDKSVWNHDLVFHFIGGIGIGHSQATGSAQRHVLEPGKQIRTIGALKHGYAIIASTGAATTTTYNLKLTGKTAHMVKQQFAGEFGSPHHTFGIGGSGGAIQQLVYAQNDPSLLDALIPIHPFQDMVTQINPVGDCELLMYYFDKVDAQVNGTGKVDPKWKSWANRAQIIGLHGADGDFTSDSHVDQDILLLQALTSSAGPGTDVCMQAWFGAIPEYLNPLWSQETYPALDPAVVALTPRSFFDDLKPIFGTIDDTGLGRLTFDNVGVQYGLQTLKVGEITPKEFLDLNAHVGGPVPRQDMVEPGFPFEGQPTPGNIDPWSARNGTAKQHLDPSDVAPRTAGSIPAMRAAYKAGLVFRGDINQPVIII